MMRKGIFILKKKMTMIMMLTKVRLLIWAANFQMEGEGVKTFQKLLKGIAWGW